MQFHPRTSGYCHGARNDISHAVVLQALDSSVPHELAVD
jgi:hypothetical protein